MKNLQTFYKKFDKNFYVSTDSRNKEYIVIYKQSLLLDPTSRWLPTFKVGAD